MKHPLFSLIYEDENVAALNKSSGIAVSPDRWDISRDRLDKLAEEQLGAEKLYTVHRIDRETSGLVLFSKNAKTHKTLSLAFESRQIKKRYIAVVQGRPSWKESICDLPLIPNGNKKHMTIIDQFRGKVSLTAFRLLGSAGNYSVLEALPETGRTHQIRVHLVSLGHPVVCDGLYGKAKPVKLSSFKSGWRGDPLQELPLISRLGLHAAELFLPDYQGADGEGLSLKAPVPRDLAALIRQMEKAAGQDFGVTDLRLN